MIILGRGFGHFLNTMIIRILHSFLNRSIYIFTDYFLSVSNIFYNIKLKFLYIRI